MPEQYKYLSLKDTMGAADRDNAMMENSRINQDAAKFNQQVAREDRATSENMRMLQIGAGATKYMLDNPDSVPSVIPKLTEAGILPPDYDWQQEDPDELMAEIQEANHQFMAQLGGGQVVPDDNRPSAVRETEWYQEQSPEVQNVHMLLKRTYPGLQIKKIPMPDGSEMMVNYDEKSGQMFDLQGKEIVGAIDRPGQPQYPGGDAAPVQTAEQPADFGVSQAPAAAKVAELEAVDEYKWEKEAPAMLMANRQMIDQIQDTIDNAERAAGLASGWSTGPASQVMGKLGATDARTLKAALQPVLASLAFDRLRQMREASKTGGALGQVSERELDLLMNSRFALDQAQEPEDIIYQLQRVMQHYENTKRILIANEMLMSDSAVFAKNPAEAAKLPPGTVFVDLTGTIRRVPVAQ